MVRLTSLLFLATQALASPLAQLEDRAIGQADFNRIRFYVEYAMSSYCNSENTPGGPLQCEGNTCATATSNGATTVSTFSGLLTGISGLVAVDPVAQNIIVSFRGSSNIRNWITNFDFFQTSCSDLTPGCLIHGGFLNAWHETRSAVNAAITSARAANPSYQLIFTGHSLGGAVATIAAAYSRPTYGTADLFTYGSPRVGNYEFVDFVTKQNGVEFRVTHGNDPVPRVPLIAQNYRHVSPEYWLPGSDIKLDYKASDVQVCTGYASLGCNMMLPFIVEILAHINYLVDLAGCFVGGFLEGIFRRQENTPTDQEIEDIMKKYAALDIAYVKMLEATGGR